MKTKLLALTFASTLALQSCKSSDNTITGVSSAETETELIVYALYPTYQIPKVESFLDSVFKQKISLDQDVDMPAQLNNTEKVNIRSGDGRIEIIYSKKDSTAIGYAAVKKLRLDLSNKLVPSVKAY